MLYLRPSGKEGYSLAAGWLPGYKFGCGDRSYSRFTDSNSFIDV